MSQPLTTTECLLDYLTCRDTVFVTNGLQIARRLSSQGHTVYLPAGASWTLANTGDVYEGGKAYEIEAPIETLPIFLRD